MFNHKFTLQWWVKSNSLIKLIWQGTHSPSLDIFWFHESILWSKWNLNYSANSFAIYLGFSSTTVCRSSLLTELSCTDQEESSRKKKFQSKLTMPLLTCLGTYSFIYIEQIFLSLPLLKSLFESIHYMVLNIGLI